ncbi:hypothetical protein BHM03_00027464 [Ensete ventricosum]|nr:hypothetical protein BHM03_00027464 [Ensete ventricosum]
MFAVRGGAADSQTTAVVFFTVEEEEEEEEESGNDRTPTANRSGTRVGRGDVPIGRVWCWLFSAESSTCQCLIEGPTRAPHAPYHTLTDSCRRRTERPYVFAESRLKTSLALFGIASTRGSIFIYCFTPKRIETRELTWSRCQKGPTLTAHAFNDDKHPDTRSNSYIGLETGA